MPNAPSRDSTAAVTPELLKKITDRVYKMLLADLKRERERRWRKPARRWKK